MDFDNIETQEESRAPEVGVDRQEIFDQQAARMADWHNNKTQSKYHNTLLKSYDRVGDDARVKGVEGQGVGRSYLQAKDHIV
jgi:hypothetical protein